MRRIEGNKKLNLNKETLRTISSEELGSVAGGTLGGSIRSINTSILTGMSTGRGFCVTDPEADPNGQPSMPAICMSPLPNPTISILPSIVPGGR